uniref:Lactase like n=1 Tax=Leptobrachium leishanense TaxID=445787 RepID=A0A8C5MFH7_9ANUR
MGHCYHCRMVSCVLCVLLVLSIVLCAHGEDDFQWTQTDRGSFYYGTFPPTFMWGVGSSAYQTEGAWDSDGKGKSIWDVFTHKKGKVYMNQTADSSCDGYYKVKDDLALLKELNVSHYRLSISWPRIIPTGVRAEHVNEKGIQYYNDLIDTLLENKIIPMITLYHWDLPQNLQEKSNGWQNISIVTYFNDYANLCFERFGDRVKHWITFNNPWAHARVWHTYSKNWRSKQKGMVGISLTTEWGEPVDLSSQKDIEAAERFVQFHFGWFANPLYNGDYPQIMKEYIGQKSAQQGLGISRLPTFTSQEKSYIKGACDFLGVGHFTTRYITNRNFPSTQGPNYFTDRDLRELVDPKWPEPESKWVYSVPWGFRRLLNFVKTQYGNPLVFVTENGLSEKMHCAQLCDEWRIQYLKGYINEVLKAMKDGVNIQGYTAWSLMDKFEWDEGFSERFGLYYVEFRNKNKPRYPKASVQFYKKVIGASGFPNVREVEKWHRLSTESCSTTNQLLAAEEQRNAAANILRLIHDPLVSHMEMVTEIVVPTVCTLCILISAILLMILLRRQI